MDVPFEAEVMRLLEAALAKPSERRIAWLDAAPASAAAKARVRDLLDAEAGIGGFLEDAAPIGALAGAMAGLPAGGERVGAWRMLRELDAGGMGVVWLAIRDDGSYEQDVAIKFIRTDHLLDADSRAAIVARFENERRLLARVEHPNVARILDGGRTGSGLPYLVMEYIDGVPLGEWCEAKRLDVAARIALLAEVCEGVQAAHRHLIVHRDLKPQNILVDAEGRPHLLDFGIARTLDAGASAAATRTLVSAMTPAYASPEQMRLEPLTTASDVYSLGVILYELIGGSRPYSLEGLGPAESERVISESRRKPLRQAILAARLSAAERRARLGAVGGDLERIAAKALHKDPQRRYDSAQALAEDLRRYLGGRPVLAHPDSTAYRLARFVRRHRIGTAAAAIALAAILGATSTAIVQARAARRSAGDMASVNAFLIDVLQASNPYQTGSEITLSAALDDAAGKVDERFGDRPDLAVAIRNALGESLFASYRLDAAEIQLQRARADGERVLGRDDARTINAIATLANVRKEQDRTADARVLFEEALARLERSGQTGIPLYASVLNDLGVLYIVGEDFEHAREYLERAVDADSGATDRDSADQRARTLASLASAERGLGHLDRADALYREAEPVLEAAYPGGGPHLAVLLNNRARLAWTRGRKDEAIALQKRAVAMHQASFHGDHVMVLVPMTNLAFQALDTGDLALADEWGRKAAAMADRLYRDQGHPYQVNALTVLAGVRIAQRRPGDAADLLLRAREILGTLKEAPASTRQHLDDAIGKLCREEPALAASICSADARDGSRRG